MNKKLIFGFSVLATVLVLAAGSTAHAALLTRQLEFGMSGSDVSSLQIFLAADPTIYPQGLVTGYFGLLTRVAVSNFQVRNGISPVGRVGPITLAAINAQMGGGVSVGNTAPIISNVNVSTGVNSATFHWNTNEPAVGIVYYGTSWMPMTETEHDAIINGTSARMDSSLRSSEDITISGLQSNTTYYYVVYTKDAGGDATIIWPATFKTQ